MRKILPHAIVDPNARIADDVEIGPFCVVGPDVTIGSGCRLHNHVTLMNHVTLGKDNVLFPGVILGAPPQDKKFKGTKTQLIIGDNNHFREHVTMHIGTETGGGATRVGSNCLFMVNSHVGHDSQLGDNIIFANNVMISGHVIIHDNVNMGGGSGVRHNCTIGEFGFVTALTRVTQDVPPFCVVDGANVIRGTNAVGLRRGGFTPEDVDAIDDACKRLFYYRTKPFSAAMAEFDTMNGINPYVKRLIDFLRMRDQGKQGRFLESRRH